MSLTNREAHDVLRDAKQAQAQATAPETHAEGVAKLQVLQIEVLANIRDALSKLADR